MIALCCIYFVNNCNPMYSIVVVCIKKEKSKTCAAIHNIYMAVKRW